MINTWEENEKIVEDAEKKSGATVEEIVDDGIKTIDTRDA